MYVPCSIILLLVFHSISELHATFFQQSFYNLIPRCKFNAGDTYSNCINTRTSATCKADNPYRTHDGTCNNLFYKTRGSSNTPLKRLVRADYIDGGKTPRGFPCRIGYQFYIPYSYYYNHHHHSSYSLKRWTSSYPTAHQVSIKLFKITTKNVKNLKGFSTMFMTFGQFLDHDMTLVPHESCKPKDCKDESTAFKYPCFPIKFDQDKPECTGFARSKPACKISSHRYRQFDRNQVNTITSFVDGGNIYGNSADSAKRLRLLDGSGKMKLSTKGLLPLDPHQIKTCKTKGGCSLVGDERGDENIALHSMHTLWVREHNRIATKLKYLNKGWNGEKVYQTARKIVGAQLQHITFTEWLPNIVELPKYTGYNKYTDPSIINAFAAAAFRFGHSLIPNAFSHVDKNFNKLREDLLLQKAFFNTDYIHKYGIESTILGLVANQSNEVNMELSEGIARKLFIPFGQKGYDDLAARNIQRGRDHGIHVYGEWRKRCHLAPLRSFDDLKKYMQKGAADVFEHLYSHPNDIDLFAAGLAEIHLPGLVVGPTFSCIFKHQFAALRDGDRFYYENKNIFTPAQLLEIKKASLAKVLCNNVKDVVSLQKNVFKTFDYKHQRVSCGSIPDIDLKAWVYKEPKKICNIGNTYSNCITLRKPTYCKRWSPYRSIDGTCNNLGFGKSTWGATNTQLRRLTAAIYIDGYDTPRGFPCIPNKKETVTNDIPTAHEVSTKLFKITTKNVKNQKSLSTMYMTFGQFLDHDITLTPHESCKVKDCSNSLKVHQYPCFPIKFNKRESRCTGFARSKPVCIEPSKTSPGNNSPRNQVNKITSFIDGSTIYGSDPLQARRLRTLDGTGKLKVTKGNLLPLNLLVKDCKTLGGCSLVGDERGDENIALNSMHTLWVREHNRIATKLKHLNYYWNGEKVYQETRKIVGALIQHIVYEEYLPKIAKLNTYYRYSSYVNPSIINAFATAAFRFGHSLVPNAFSQVDKDFNKLYGDVLLQRAFFNITHIHKYGIDSTIMGLISNQSDNVNMEFSHGVARKLFIPFGDKSGYDDLLARNIQRGRDHGIPTYGAYREKCRLSKIKTFEDLDKIMQKGAAHIFKKLYTHPDDIDLFAAGIAENHLDGLIVGETFSCIFRHQFDSLRKGDRFFYANPRVFRSNQLNALKKMTLAKVICNNLDGIVSIQKDVFKSYYAGAKRVECSYIPDLDLREWKQKYYRNHQTLVHQPAV